MACLAFLLTLLCDAFPPPRPLRRYLLPAGEGTANGGSVLCLAPGAPRAFPSRWCVLTRAGMSVGTPFLFFFIQLFTFNTLSFCISCACSVLPSRCRCTTVVGTGEGSARATAAYTRCVLRASSWTRTVVGRTAVHVTTPSHARIHLFIHLPACIHIYIYTLMHACVVTDSDFFLLFSR